MCAAPTCPSRIGVRVSYTVLPCSVTTRLLIRLRSFIARVSLSSRGKLRKLWAMICPLLSWIKAYADPSRRAYFVTRAWSSRVFLAMTWPAAASLRVVATSKALWSIWVRRARPKRWFIMATSKRPKIKTIPPMIAIILHSSGLISFQQRLSGAPL